MPRPKVFISYSSQDRGPVSEIARKLKEAGIDVWFDIWNLKPGDDWMTGLENGLRECTCCAIFFGPSGTGPWHSQEIRASINRAARARDGDFRVIPVLLPGGSMSAQQDVPDFLALRVWVEFHKGAEDEEAFESLKWGISGQGGPPTTQFEGANPYRGLEAFDVSDARFFFGRDNLIEQMLARLQAMLDGGASNRKLLVLVGNSGSGKSSLARAGLIGAIKAGRFSVPGSARWPVAIFKPGVNPLENAAIELAALQGETPGSRVDARSLRDALAVGDQELNFFAKQLLRNYPSGSRLIMLVDQFEECFTSAESSASREKFFGNLIHAAQSADGQVLTILTLRADFYNECLHNPGLGGIVSDCLFPVQPMTAAELQEAIERPAQVAGLTFEPGLVQLILSENLDSPSCLPLLQFTLSELWRISRPRITLEAYNKIGRSGGALAGKAEEVYSRLSVPEQEICHHLFLRLVRRTERARYASHRVALSELITSRAGIEKVRPLLQKLTGEGSRLLTVESETSRVATASDNGGHDQDFVGLAHEVLIQSWPRFRDWLREDNEFQLWRERFSVSLDQWRNVNRKNEALLRGKSLVDATKWQRLNQSDLNAEENDFINRSQRYKKLEMAALAVFVLLAGVLLYTWVEQKNIAYRHTQQLYSEALASLSRNFDDSELVRPLLISLYAFQISENEETLEALQDAVVRAGGPAAEHDGVLRAVAATQDGKLLAATWDDGLVQLWEPRTGAPNGADPSHIYRKVGGDLAAQNGALALAISADGTRLAVAGNQPGIDLWALPTREHRVLESPQAAIKSIDFNPNAKELLIAPWDRPVVAQSVDQPASQRTLPNSEHAWQAIFCPVDPCAGLALASGAAVLEDLSASAGRPLSQETEAIKSVEFSRDGKTLGFGDAGGSAKIVSIGSGKTLAQFAEDSGVDRILISPDGNLVVTLNSGGSASVWEISTGRLRMKLRAKDSFRSAAFTRYGDAPHVAFGTRGGKLLIYDLDFKHLRKRAYEVWLANGKPALKPSDCDRYLHQKSCPSLVWDQ
jgi:WD40 repeat protein